MKRTKKRKLVLTDGTWYYYNSTYRNSIFTDNPREAWNFNYEGFFSNLNKKKTLLWQVDTWTKHEPVVYDNKGREIKDVKIDRSKFTLKWITIIETIKEEEFNYEGFTE